LRLNGWSIGRVKEERNKGERGEKNNGGKNSVAQSGASSERRKRRIKRGLDTKKVDRKT